MINKPTKAELIARYIEDTANLYAQDQACAVAQMPADIGRRAMSLYGAGDAAKALRDRFGVDVVGDAGRKQ
jgi:hypothetical protein